MSAQLLAETFEKLKELRRQGGLITEELESDELKDELKKQLFNLLKLHDAFLKGADKLAQQSDILIRTLEIKMLADRVFGEEKKAAAWLDRPNTSLSGQRPVDLLMDELGTAVVREMLERIDHGIFA